MINDSLNNTIVQFIHETHIDIFIISKIFLFSKKKWHSFNQIDRVHRYTIQIR